MRRVASVLAIAATVVVAVSIAAGPAAGSAVGTCVPGTGWPAARADLAQQVVALVNSHRQQLGLSTLHVSPTLTQSAVWKAEHMAQYQYMQHDDPAPPVTRTVAQRLDACGYPGDTSGWGENIAYGFQTAQDVMNAWLNSPGHKANIENPSFRSIGVGAATATTGAVYWAQDFGTVDDSGTTGGGSGGTTAPTVKLTTTPPSTGAASSATFGWTTTGSVSTTTCSLDGAAASACAAPKSYSGLVSGSHTFRVSVSGPGGSATTSYTWSVGAATQSRPTVRITAVSASQLSASATFWWSTTGTVTSTTCSLDYGPARTCASPASYTGLARGVHTFRVTVANALGSAWASYSWTAA